MKLTLVLVVLMGLAVGSWAEDKETVNAFEHSFNMLHKEPPPPESKSRANVQTLWIEQKLNHFDNSETKTWQMVRNSKIFQQIIPKNCKTFGTRAPVEKKKS